MLEGDSADMCAEKFPLMLIGGQAEGLATQTRERGPHQRERKYFSRFKKTKTKSAKNYLKGRENWLIDWAGVDGGLSA
jgi:hypothetical protein